MDYLEVNHLANSFSIIKFLQFSKKKIATQHCTMWNHFFEKKLTVFKDRRSILESEIENRFVVSFSSRKLQQLKLSSFFRSCWKRGIRDKGDVEDRVLENHRSRSSYSFSWPVNWYSCTRRVAGYDPNGGLWLCNWRVARVDAFGQGTHFRFGPGSRILLMVTLRWTGPCRFSLFNRYICPLLISSFSFFLFRHLRRNLIKR